MNPACSIAASRTLPSALANLSTARGMALICSMRLIARVSRDEVIDCVPMLGHYHGSPALPRSGFYPSGVTSHLRSSLMEPDSLDCGPGFQGFLKRAPYEPVTLVLRMSIVMPRSIPSHPFIQPENGIERIHEAVPLPRILGNALLDVAQHRNAVGGTKRNGAAGGTGTMEPSIGPIAVARPILHSRSQRSDAGDSHRLVRIIGKVTGK